MGKAITLPSHHRVQNYANQDLAIHNYVERNCPTYMTPAQRRRVNKKMRSTFKIKAHYAPVMNDAKY